MIIHKLIRHHLKHKDDAQFYTLQALDAIRWMETLGVSFNAKTSVLDLGCGHGIFGAELLKRGSPVVFADEGNYLMPQITQAPFRKINLDVDDISSLGSYDVVVCSNVFEHLGQPRRFLDGIASALNPGGFLYLSWTNWLSPWGGHEFSPWHYLGVERGHLLFDRLVKRPRIHTPHQNLFPTYIGQTLAMIRQNRSFRVVRVVPRYYPELAFVMSIPLLREFVAWNCAILLQKTTARNP